MAVERRDDVSSADDTKLSQPSDTAIVSRLASLAGISAEFSEDAHQLLAFAVNSMKRKRVAQETLSSSTLLFAAIAWGGLQDSRPLPPDPLARLAQLLIRESAERLDAMMSVFFAERDMRADPAIEEAAEQTFTLSGNLAGAIKQYATNADGPVTAADLVLWVLFTVRDGPYKGEGVPKRLEALGQTAEGLIAVLLGTGEEQQARSQVMWLCQYRRSKDPTVEEELRRGTREFTWNVFPCNVKKPEERANAGDLAVLWRTTDEVRPPEGEKSRGGIVGWGHVRGVSWIDDGPSLDITLVYVDPDDVVGRDDVRRKLGNTPENWPDQVSLRLLTDDEAAVFLKIAEERGVANWQSSQTKAYETPLSSDRPETLNDTLGRAPLAFALAHHVNRIWTEQNPRESDVRPGDGDTDAKRRAEEPDKAAFVMHIDAPWGGGKTTFANFVSRILNPYRLEEAPGLFQWISRRLRPERHLVDRSAEKKGLFEHLTMAAPDWPSDYAKRRWVSVYFNAWANQHVSPPWWNLYEAIRAGCLKGLPFRVYIKSVLKEFLWRVLTKEVVRTAIGVLIALPLFFAAYSMLTPGEVPGASNGDDVSLLVSLLVVFTGGAGLAIFRAIRAGTKRIVEGAVSSVDANALGESDPVRSFRRHFEKSIKAIGQPVLVVIDDLDRCEPAYVVEIVRGLITIFRSPRVVFMLLGDRKRIETAFATVHADMVASHSDPGSTFGSRFVEKAIQLSFVLPEPTKEARSTYVDRLLREPAPSDAAGGEADTADGIEAMVAETAKELAGARTAAERDRIFTSAKARAATEFRESPEALQIAEERINVAAALKTASSARSIEEVEHSLASYKALLPGNPRRTKRIVNMIAVYLAAAQATIGLRQDSPEYHQMVLWLILLSEFPKAWLALSRDPDIFERLTKGSLTQEEEDDIAVVGQRLRALLSGVTLADEKTKVELSKEAIGWLRNLVPVS